MDVLLRDKLSLADAGGVRTVLSLALPRPCVVEDLDWCILFANALDNALHACRRVEGEASIRISGTRQGDFYLLEFQNTRPDEPLQPAGTGLRNIRAAAEKYHGAMAAEADGPAFRLHILLDISRPPDGISEQSP